ncbi:carbohydrate ABC transporter permease [Clostridium oryzae]|uniref:L-arabinose transport system permease protein AraQ n=1 Tax=Clostridium oryzae TaxID=1450648 RepID=A0A1V4IZB8_9CLOT|nr:carbohydrate ABC transporter permease [Clostridium oryzae]OPJ65266.1 L-arabinose transport system permease protein AraQ [Clostridium oryzae]
MEFKKTNSRIVDKSSRIIQIFSYIFITIFSLLCLVPFILMVSSSFSSEKAITEYGYTLWPKQFSIFAYKLIFENPKLIIGDYVVTICITVIGTAIGLTIIAMTGYALQRPDFPYRNKISFYIFFTTLFSGGLVPFYLLISKYMHLQNNYLAILLPGLMSPWLIILMKNFLKSIPHSITESAKIDGAGDFTIFLRIILPMATPALATIGLFLALGYWNEWYNSMLFLSANVTYRPLQLFLYNVVTQADFIRNSAASSNVPAQDIPNETMKMATAVVAVGPVILFYPFVQKYFIAGITIGAVKG